MRRAHSILEYADPWLICECISICECSKVLEVFHNFITKFLNLTMKRKKELPHLRSNLVNAPRFYPSCDTRNLLNI